MDDLLRDFLTDTGEHLETVDLELVRLERDPGDEAILRNVFRLVHTIKGTCGFIGLPRLEALAHAAESLMGRLRDGARATPEMVALILATVDRLKIILAELDRSGGEPSGEDGELIERLGVAAGQAASAAAAPAPAAAAPTAPARPSAPSEAPGPRAHSIRVGLGTLEQLMTTVSELVLTRNQLLDIARRHEGDDLYAAPLRRLSQVTAELQDGIMKTRMQPIGAAWAKLPRLVRDLAAELGKPLDLVTLGQETELDRQLLETVRDPLVHLVRNCADHGIEAPDLRRRAGKPARGTITLLARQESGTITVEVSDDGGGLDYAAIRRRAAEQGLAEADELAALPDEEVAAFVFRPGFSTCARASQVSGRGIGMDVVKTNVEAVGGAIEVRSVAGRGTTFSMKVPLTLAIVAALVVEAGGQRFVLPQVVVIEVVRVGSGSGPKLERIERSAVLRLRDELLPVVDLAELLGLGAAAAEDGGGHVVVAQVGRQRFGIAVERVLETEEIVVKPISARLRHIPYFSGHTVLGDGAVVVIIEPDAIARTLGAERGAAGFGGRAPEAARPQETLALLVFRGRDRAMKAVPLSLVFRLEEVEASEIEWVAGRPTLMYRGGLLPLAGLDGDEGIRREGRQPLIVFAEGGERLGLAVDEIVDVVDVPDAIACAASGSAPTSIVRGRVTEILDLARHLPWTGRPVRGHGPRPLLLLVDASAFFRDMLAPVLKAAGYRVRSVAGAEAALAVLAGGDVAALVAGLDLPGRCGLDLVEAMRGHARSAGVPAILLGSSCDEAVLERARSLGVHDVVARFDRDGLLASLAEAADPVRDAA